MGDRIGVERQGRVPPHSVTVASRPWAGGHGAVQIAEDHWKEAELGSGCMCCALIRGLVDVDGKCCLEHCKIDATSRIETQAVLHAYKIGGSNSGLMNGIVLKRQGHNVHILEQNTQSQRNDLAAGITTHPDFVKFMELHDQVVELWSVPSEGIQFLNKSAGVKRRLNVPLEMTSWGLIYHRLRANFDGFASEFCPNIPEPNKTDGTALFDVGKRVKGISLVNSAVEVTYEDLLKDSEKGTFRADRVIIADGANSRLRAALFPEVKRVYAGYVAFRGTVNESDVSDEAKNTFHPKLSYYSFKNGYILLYIIPGADGSLDEGHRRYNWVWYHPLEENSSSLREIMTDVSGTVHRNILPVGAMQLSAWAPYVSHAEQVMCAPFAEMVRKTTHPFITAVSDVACPNATALEGKVMIVGEALALIRPHMALSTTQCAIQALLVDRVFNGEISLQEWEKQVLRSARLNALKTNAYGYFFLYGWLSALEWIAKLVSVMILGMRPFSWFSGGPSKSATAGEKKD
ncbi:hypothetical protein G7Y89_g14464 [Cudoniella acicularis]|uniref:2,6-dihydroxypyridine 3-monooxygenase substrate binding domain-containing protein n=1 Tax=Cudoniella acicularis TaxID=354080 RepID=A0A8H4VT78_9HELO|nr:hypothetical protein G7Y89_g14464 [Cudoniella acicularis]